MIADAIRAHLPLISVTTDDIINVKKVLQHYTDLKVVDAKNDYNNIQSSKVVYFQIKPEEFDYNYFYKHCVAHDACLVVVNPDEEVGTTAFDAGVLPLPLKILEEVVQQLTDDYEDVVTALAGLTLKDSVELLKLCTTKYGVISKESITTLRRDCAVNPTGVSTVSTEYIHYSEDTLVRDWVDNLGPFITRGDIPKELRPRGLLLAGTTGCGKTLSSKYIAKELNLPLFLLDLNSILDKYVGNSERNLRKAFEFFNTVQPCLVLIDEVEKIFSSREESGPKLLAQLLWWLQEHNDQIVTIMTTNDKDKIPSELIRPGRIEAVISFEQITSTNKLEIFVYSLLSKLQEKIPTLTTEAIDQLFFEAGCDVPITHAQATTEVYNAVRGFLRQDND